jgi:CYTH domain-containing protein
MALEIERKFFVKQIPTELEQFPHKEIIQWYFSDPTTGKNIRVRKIWDEYKVTRKKWHGLVREEIEVTITKEEFDQLWFQVENHFLEKTRYYIPYEWLTIEFDLYKNLQNLKTAEVEFTSKRDAKKFIIPERFDQELTTIREATNGYIAKHWLDGELLAMLQN